MYRASAKEQKVERLCDDYALRECGSHERSLAVVCQVEDRNDVINCTFCVHELAVAGADLGWKRLVGVNAAVAEKYGQIRYRSWSVLCILQNFYS